MPTLAFGSRFCTISRAKARISAGVCSQPEHCNVSYLRSKIDSSCAIKAAIFVVVLHRSPTSHSMCKGGWCHFCNYRRISSLAELALIVHSLCILEAYCLVGRVLVIHCIRRNLFALCMRERLKRSSGASVHCCQDTKVSITPRSRLPPGLDYPPVSTTPRILCLSILDSWSRHASE